MENYFCEARKARNGWFRRQPNLVLIVISVIGYPYKNTTKFQNIWYFKKVSLFSRQGALLADMSTLSMYVILEAPLTWNPVDGSEGPEDPYCPDGGEVQLLHVQAVFKRTKTGSTQAHKNRQYSSTPKKAVFKSLKQTVFKRTITGSTQAYQNRQYSCALK